MNLQFNKNSAKIYIGSCLKSYQVVIKTSLKQIGKELKYKEGERS